MSEDKKKLIEEIEKLLPDADWSVLKFVYFYIIS